MNIKKHITVSERLLFPLKEGDRAVIVRGGDFICTSRVMEVLEIETDHVLFETINSVYRVALEPVPIKVALPIPLAMCA